MPLPKDFSHAWREQVGQKGQMVDNNWPMLAPAFPTATQRAGFCLGMPALKSGPGVVLEGWLGEFSPNFASPVLKSGLGRSPGNANGDALSPIVKETRHHSDRVHLDLRC